MIKKLLIGIKELCFFSLGRIFAVIIYDKKYLKSKYFKSRYGGIGAKGWHWIVSDCTARFFLGINKGVPFPISPRVSVQNPKNIEFDPDDLNNFQGLGNYYQALGGGKIKIGKGSWIGPNVGIITTNHNISNPSVHTEGKQIMLGENCWIGMNSVILPGVILGSHTTVGAGSVVTKSFPEGFCVIAGNPAKKIKDINVTEE